MGVLCWFLQLSGSRLSFLTLQAVVNSKLDNYLRVIREVGKKGHISLLFLNIILNKKIHVMARGERRVIRIYIMSFHAMIIAIEMYTTLK